MAIPCARRSSIENIHKMKIVLKSKEIVDELPFCVIKKVLYIQDSDCVYTVSNGKAIAYIDGYKISFIIDPEGLVDQNSIKIV